MARTAVFYDNGTFDAGSTISLVWRLRSITGNVTLATTDQVVVVDATSAAVTVTLPAVAGMPAGTWYAIKKTDATGNTVTVDANASETIDGATTQVITGRYTTLTIVSDGSSWHIV